MAMEPTRPGSDEDPADITSSGVLTDRLDLAALTAVRRVDPYSEVSSLPISLVYASQLLQSALVPTAPAAPAAYNSSAQEQWQGLSPNGKHFKIDIAQIYLRGLALRYVRGLELEYGRVAQEGDADWPHGLLDRALASAANNTEISEFEAVSGELESWLRKITSYPSTQDTHAIARQALAVALAAPSPNFTAEQKYNPNFLAERRYEADAALMRMSPEEREGLLTRVAFQVGINVARVADLVASQSLGLGVTDIAVRKAYSLLASISLPRALLRDSKTHFDQSIDKWRRLRDTGAKIKIIEGAKDYLLYIAPGKGMEKGPPGRRYDQPHLLLRRAADTATKSSKAEYDEVARELQGWLAYRYPFLTSAPETIMPIAHEALRVALTTKDVVKRQHAADKVLAQITHEDREKLLTQVAQQLLSFR
jgi:hypothetical protein